MKNNREILISYCPPVTDKYGRLVYKPDGTLVRPSTGHSFQHVSLYDKLHEQLKYSKDSVKGSDGEIYAYLADSLGIRQAEEAGKNYSDGIIFIDIDKMSKTDVSTIYNSFEKITKELPNVLSCWYSNSYYNQSKEYGGLHFILKVSNDIVSANEYRYYVTWYGAILARMIYKVCNIDIRPNNGGLDKVTKGIAQRFYLNYSEVKWNDGAYVIDPVYDKKELEKWINEVSDYKEKWIKEENQYKTTKCEITSYNLTPNGEKHNLGYQERITIINTLSYIGLSHDERVSFMLAICDGSGFKGDFKANVIQCSKTAENQKVDLGHISRGIEMLKSFGYDIEADIEEIYAPLDYNVDSLFEEVMEAEKDKPFHNVHYNPENVLRLNLTKDEYLMDYQDKIHSMVSKYEMTYLIADCMTGKTTLANNYKAIFSMFNDADMFLYVRGNTIDVCFPYNSVADNKSKKYRRDLKRVKTKDIENYSFDLTNNFIWNTLMPLYERYFSNGTTPKNFILFFDESQKIVTDEYRWAVVFEMFKVLPAMYKHFVFMTGTPAGEFFFLKQYFKDYCIIKVDKEIDYKRECKFLKYEKFGYRDRINLIEDTIANGRLPLIYTNVKRYEWIDACHEINKNRVEAGLKPLRILEYSRANSERLEEVAETNSIKKYDVVIATKYCSVGIDFKKDDKRMRTAIIDYASEKDCTVHDIWQFTLRNRDQDTMTKIIVNNDDMFNNKLYNFWYYEKLFDDMAKVHTHKKVEFEPESELDKLNIAFVQEIFQIRNFGNIIYSKKEDKQYFKDMNNVKLLSIYYLYRKIFSNINVIKRMLIERGVEIVEVDMPHIAEKNESTTKKEIYDFFVEKFKEVGEIYHSREEYEEISKQIDVNSDDKEHIDGRIIYTRNKSYADWFIKNFAGKDEWYEILKEREFMSTSIFAEFNRMRMIAKRINKTIIKKLKSFKDNFDEEKFTEWVLERVKHDYEGVKDITNDEFRKELLFKDVVDDYLKIYRFSVDNIELIEEIKTATDEGIVISACHKMDIVIRQRLNEEAKKKMSIAGKKHAKKIIVRDLRDNLEYEFDSMLAAANHFGVTKSTFSKFVKNGSGMLKKMALVIAS